MQIPEIKNALKEALRDPNRRASYFIGGRGSGKSTLLTQTFKEVLEEERKRNDAKKLFFNTFR
jgi:predicted AAA+ superfamily ATPase